MKTDIVIGLGETGRPLLNVLREGLGKETVVGYDAKIGKDGVATVPVRYMHICIPYNSGFVGVVKEYQKLYMPYMTVIHSTVPIGTTSKIENAVHSPILGRHEDMEGSLWQFSKWVGGKDAEIICKYFESANIKSYYIAEKSETTEVLKLLCLAKYGMSIAFADFCSNISEEYNFSYEMIKDWDRNYNEGVNKELRRPILDPPYGKIGGHCVIQNTKILNEQHPNPILEEILKLAPKEEKEAKEVKVWPPANVYPSAKLGEDVSIGMFSEIGHNVEIGDGTRVGKGSFIPEGVKIGKNVFIGPHVCFSNDKYPPSHKEAWEETIVEDGASIGANATIICGVIIGANALVGAGAVVTKDIPADEIHSGVPAKPHKVHRLGRTA